jgi:hypothetical protein
MLPSGELMVLNITASDAMRSYRCRTHHQLTQEAVVSRNVGRIQLTGEEAEVTLSLISDTQMWREYPRRMALCPLSLGTALPRFGVERGATRLLGELHGSLM